VIQKQLPRPALPLTSSGHRVRFILGLDCAFPRNIAPFAVAAAALWDMATKQAVRIWRHRARTPIPYVPGLLGFREVPLMLAVLELVDHSVDAILVDGQGRAHPKRLGSASHLALWLAEPVPVIGVAKTRLVGEFEPLLAEAGASTPLIDRGEVIGQVLRSKGNCQPLFISSGGYIDTDGALATARDSVCGYRLPEPIRLADQAAGQPWH